MKINRKFRGYLLGAVAAATYGLNPLFALPLYEDGMNPDSVLFFRYLLALPIVAAMLLFRRRSFNPGWRNWLPLLMMGFIFVVSSLSLFESYRYMPAGLASTLLFVYPIMVAVIMVLFYKEKLTLLTAGSIVTATAGIALLYQGDGAPVSAIGSVLVFVSSLSYAIYIVYINHSRLTGVPTLAVTFYVLLFGWSMLAVKALAGSTLMLPSEPAHWLNIGALALFPTAISLLCTTAAIQDIGSTPTAILGALEPVTAVAVGAVVFGEALTPRLCVGLVMIIGAVSCVVAGGRVNEALTRFRRLFPSLRRRRG